MTLTVIVLDSNEEFLQFLDPNILELSEENEVNGLRHIDVTYQIESLNNARELFKIGHKIWVSGDENLTDCLYVINTNVEKDLYLKNNVVFTAEEVLVELNYAEPFSQTDLTAKNQFTLKKTNGESSVVVNHEALNFWFGDYFTIGIVQDCLSDLAARVAPKGTMNKMELLRFIEEQTSNVFIARYEKDLNTNVIHRFLDFLNPNNDNKDWNLTFEYILPPNEAEDPVADTYEDIDDLDDIVTFPNEERYVPSIDDLVVRFLHNGVVIELDDSQLSFNARDIGFSENNPINQLKVSYSSTGLKITCNKKTFTATGDATANLWVEGTYSVVDRAPLSVECILPNHTIVQVYDEANDKILYQHEINPTCGDNHDDVLDLGYNVENITYEIDESETFNAYAPILNFDDSEFTETQMNTIISRWINLEVTKGEQIPMIIQRVTVTGTDSKPCVARTGSATSSTTTAAAILGTKNKTNNWWTLPQKRNDNTEGTNKAYEYWRATAYWYAPFSKNQGDMFIIDEADNGIEYNHICCRPDVNNEKALQYVTPKIGNCETTAEDIYDIYNTVAMALKDKRFPKINIEVNVANYKNGLYNNYNLYDKVYVKIPGSETLTTARVTKTNKNSKNMGKNTIELGNYSINTIVPLAETIIVGDNVNFKYPKKGVLNVRLLDENENPLKKKLLSYSLYETTNGTSTFTGKTYNIKTNNNGEASLTLKYDPGDYEMVVMFTGDEKYESTQATFYVNVGGKKKTATTSGGSTTKNKKTKKVTKYWTKCGLSPNKKQIVAIAQPSASVSDMRKYGVSYNQIYKTVFKNKCPYCGKATLRYDDGKKNGCITNHGHKGNKKSVPEGEITCHNCDSDFDGVTGLEKSKKHTSRLTFVKKPVKSSKSEKAKLIKGKLVHSTTTVTVKSKKNNKTTRAAPTGTVSKKVKEKALKIVGKKTGLPAAKEIAKFMGKKIKYEQNKSKIKNWSRTPESVLSAGMGNCCSQTRLMLQMWDAAGVTEHYNIGYVHVCCNSSYGCGHVFARIRKKGSSGNWTYVDPCKSNPWGHYVHGWGSPPGHQTTYPTRPF